MDVSFGNNETGAGASVSFGLQGPPHRADVSVLMSLMIQHNTTAIHLLATVNDCVRVRS